MTGHRATHNLRPPVGRGVFVTISFDLLAADEEMVVCRPGVIEWGRFWKVTRSYLGGEPLLTRHFRAVVQDEREVLTAGFGFLQDDSVSAPLPVRTGAPSDLRPEEVTSDGGQSGGGGGTFKFDNAKRCRVVARNKLVHGWW